MNIYLGADHAGFHLKEKVFAHLVKQGYTVHDEGDKLYDKHDDYPHYAYAVAVKLLGDSDNDARGILICGGGQGMAIAANRVRGIRAAVVWDEHEAKATRQDNDSNVLSVPARYFKDNEAEALKVIDTWLATPFSGAPRHVRRIKEIEELYG